MGYLLYSIFVMSIVCGTGGMEMGIALYLTRDRWIPRLPTKVQDALDYSYSRLPSNFMSDVESGLTSTDFDLSSNVMEGDSRQGLDQRAKRDVQRIMKVRGIGFDEARRVYMEQRFKREGIGADGLPRDPKLVTFS